MDLDWRYALFQLVAALVPFTVGIVGLVLFAVRGRQLPGRARSLGMVACALLVLDAVATVLFGFVVDALDTSGLSPLAVVTMFSALTTLVGTAAFVLLIAAALTGRRPAAPPGPPGPMSGWEPPPTPAG
jgi:hypothetical protein